MKSKKIKKVYRKGLLIIGLLVISASCSDVLELEPKNAYQDFSNYYINDSEVNSAFAGIYSSLSSGNVFGEHLVLMDFGTDEGYSSKSWSEKIPTNLYSHNDYTNEIGLLWQNLYSGINNVNNLLHYIDADNFEEADYNKYISEAHFLRGFFYYQLAIWWNEVPIRLEILVDQQSNHIAVSSVEDVYLQIIADLTIAVDNLPNSFDADYIAGHANKMAAHAMLAKTYLKAGGYPLKATEINGKNPFQAAKDHCQIIMDDGNYVLNSNYKDLFLNYMQNTYDLSESIFEIGFKNGTASGFNIAGRIGYTNGLFYNPKAPLNIGEPTGNNEVRPSPILDNLYELEDVRRAWNIPGYTATKNKWSPNGKINKDIGALDWGYSIGKFRRWDAIYPDDLDASNALQTPIVALEIPKPLHASLTGVNFPIIRFADVLLMYAEATNELEGPTQTAQDAINLVRVRAGLGILSVDNPNAIASPEAFFAEIVDERLKELCFEGLRKADLVRWGLLEEKIKVDLYESVIYHSKYDSNDSGHLGFLRCVDNFDVTKHLSLPYPQQEVSINNLLDQKPEW